jgi:hypothetical protein
MPEPINYLAQMPQINLGERLLRGLQIGAGFAQLQEQQAAKQQAEQRLQSYRTELESAFNQGTPKAFSRLMTMFPEHQAAIKPTFEQLSKELQEGEIAAALPVASALLSGNSKVAKDLVQERINATPEGEDTRMLQSILDAIDRDPVTAKNYTLLTLSRIMSPDKFAETFSKLAETSRAEELAPLTAAAERRKGIPSSIQEAIEFRNLTPEQQKTFQDLQVLKKPPAAVTNVSVTNLEKSASGELAKLLPDLYEQANSAASQLSDIPRYRAALNRAITGPFAEARLETAKIGAALGFTGDKAINATREVIQGLSEMALKSRSMLTGQGQITENEQKLLIKARSGDITFTKGELETIFGVAERASKAQYEKSKKLLGSAAGKSETAKMFLDNVSELPSAPQAAPKQAIYAVNPQTGQRIMSVDGGNTWTQARE